MFRLVFGGMSGERKESRWLRLGEVRAVAHKFCGANDEISELEL
jgi:hypothetical protein